MDHTSVLFKKALLTLDASGAKYRIIMPDGTHFGTLPYTEPQPENGKRRRTLRHPYGTLAAYYMPFVKDIQPGQCVDVPWGSFAPQRLQGGISSYFCRVLGNGRVMVANNHDRKSVEVLRVE